MSIVRAIRHWPQSDRSAAVGMIILIALGLAVILKIATSPSHAEDTTLFGTPVPVLDGDTLTTCGVRVRLHGLDAPEAGQQCEREARLAQRGLWAAAFERPAVPAGRQGWEMRIARNSHPAIYRHSAIDASISQWLASASIALDRARYRTASSDGRAVETATGRYGQITA